MIERSKDWWVARAKAEPDVTIAAGIPTPKRYGAEFKDWDGHTEKLTWSKKSDRDYYARKPDTLGYHSCTRKYEV